LGLPDPDSAADPDLPSSSKNSKKTLDFYCFVTNNVNVPLKSNKQEKIEEKKNV
jgi:hypothetical protein